MCSDWGAAMGLQPLNTRRLSYMWLFMFDVQGDQ